MTSRGRALPPSSRFAGDDGSGDPRLAAALARPVAAGAEDVVRALAVVRVLVPVLAELEECVVSPDGLALDKEASTGVVAVRAPDGRIALPVFSSVETMAAWRPDARPVPATGPLAAASALQEGWELLVVDPAGPAVVVPRPAVRALATGAAWAPAVHGGRVRGDVSAAVSAAVSGVQHVVTVSAAAGRSAEVAVVLEVRPGLDRAALDAVLAEAGRRLAADDVVTTVVDSVELRVVAAS